jgi:hypothetical protein
MSIQFGFFDLHKRFSKLSEAGDALERLDALIDWEMFRPELERIDRKERKSAAGRKPLDRVVMFKMLVLQSLYGLSDEALEYQVTDRLTFMRFLRIDLSGAVPDAKTVWLFREQLREGQIFDRLFESFTRRSAPQGSSSTVGRLWMRASWRPRGSAIHGKRTRRSRTGRCPWSGRRTRQSYGRRTSMRAGRRRMTRITTATRPM